MTTHNIISDLALRKVISSFSFKTFKSYGLIQDRMNMSPVLKDVFNSALEKREAYTMPFWDSFNLSLFGTEHGDFEFLKHIGFHNAPENNIIVTASDIPVFLEKIKDDFNYLTINSSVKDASGETKQLVLLDFHIPVNENNQKICSEIIKYLKLRGFLLDSGKSFHFFGTEPVSKDYLEKTLVKALLFCPVIDRAWIAHQLIEKSCCLRVSEKYNRLPLLVEEIK